MSYENYKQKIINFYRAHKRVPGYQEIMSIAGFKSKNAVYKLINKLVEDNVFSKDSRGKLTPNRLAGDVALLGLVEAGIPTTAEEQSLDTTSIEEFLMGDIKSDSFMLEVKGDSMIEAHIAEGDMILVERISSTCTAKPGDIVVAEVDGGWTLKYYRIDKKGRPYLEPANSKYKPIYPEYSLNISAKLKAVIRKV